RRSPSDPRIGRVWGATLADRGSATVACRLVDAFTDELLDEGGGIWRLMLAHLLLSEEERAAWRELGVANRRRDQWLRGRAAAKDAVRWLWSARGDGPIPPADVRIAVDGPGPPSMPHEPETVVAM